MTQPPKNDAPVVDRPLPPHVPIEDSGLCSICRQAWPCPTIVARAAPDVDAELCSCGNSFKGDNLCMPSACQWEE